MNNLHMTENASRKQRLQLRGVGLAMIAALCLLLSVAPDAHAVGAKNLQVQNPVYLTNVNGTLFFNGNYGRLFKSDGTKKGTVMLKQLGVEEIANVQGTAFFAADDDANSNALWKSDGTPEGTVMLKDIAPWAGEGTLRSLTNAKGTLFFVANIGIMFGHSHRDLWKSDGTPNGTVLVKEDITPSNLANVGSTLFFSATDGVHGYELWKSDGTPDGTFMLKDINPAGDSSPFHLINVYGTLFFGANDGNGIELWKSDGTADGTVMVKNVAPYDNPPFYITDNYAVFQHKLFFGGDDGVHGVELWQSDGTPDGTVMVRDMNPSGSSDPHQLTAVQDKLFFTADDGVHGVRLWKSNGTTIGTRMVPKAKPSENLSPSNLTRVAGKLYMTNDDGKHGAVVWTSDGTKKGTGMVQDLRAGPWNPKYLTNVNGTLFFAGDLGNGFGYQLWVYKP